MFARDSDTKKRFIDQTMFENGRPHALEQSQSRNEIGWLFGTGSEVDLGWSRSRRIPGYGGGTGQLSARERTQPG